MPTNRHRAAALKRTRITGLLTAAMAFKSSPAAPGGFTAQAVPAGLGKPRRPSLPPARETQAEHDHIRAFGSGAIAAR